MLKFDRSVGVSGAWVLVGLSLFFYSLLMKGIFTESFVLEISLMKLSAISFNIPFLLSWDSLIVASTVYLISGCVILYSKEYLKGDITLGRYFNLLYLFVLSMTVLVFFPSLLFLVLGWDGLGFTSFLLIVYYSGSSESAFSGIFVTLFNRVGDIFLFLSICLTGFMVGGFWFGSLSVKGILSSSDFALSAFCLLVAAMTKSAQFPFCSWLPVAMAAPTPISALVHSSTLVTAGVYLLYRYQDMIFVYSELCMLLTWVSVLTMFFSGLSASSDRDAKIVVAHSTVGHLGFMVFVISLGFPDYGLFHLVVHALCKATMFLCLGVFIFASGHSQDLRSLSFCNHDYGYYSSMLMVANVCSSGSLFIGSFCTKEAIIELAFMSVFGSVLTAMMSVGLFMTFFYTGRISYYLSFGGTGKPESLGSLPIFFLFPISTLGVSASMIPWVFSGLFSLFSYPNFVFSGYGLMMTFLFPLLGWLVASAASEWGKETAIRNYMFLEEIYIFIYKGLLSLAKNCFMFVDQGVFECFIGGLGLGKSLDHVSSASMKLWVESSLLAIFVVIFYCGFFYIYFTFFMSL